MAKVGRTIADPKAGAYCHITLDSGEKLVVNHDRAGRNGRLTIDVVRLMGLNSTRICTCDLDTREGQAALDMLRRDAPQGSARQTPLGALVEHLRYCASVAEIKTACAALLNPSATNP